MKQLGNQDAGFIYNETATTPMHVAGLGIYSQPPAQDRPDHNTILNYIQARIHLAPILRHKYTEVPLGLDKPYWVDDGQFDLSFHIRHIALPAPGNWQQLTETVARLHAEPIDFEHPLWEAYIIEGLNNFDGLSKNSFAIFVKIHHAIADGASGQAIFSVFNDLTATAQPQPPTEPIMIERPPTGIELISRAIPNLIKRPLSQSASIYQRAPKMLQGALKFAQGRLNSGTKFKVPQTRFNHAISNERTVQGTCFSLPEIKKIKAQLKSHVTINDIMLTIIAGGLRNYLKELNELPEESLCAMMPVDTRTETTKDHQGNHIGGIFTDLHTHLNNPIERLNAISQSTSEAKTFAEELDTSVIVQNYMGGFFNPALGKTFNRLIQHAKLTERLGTVMANTLVTNVKGPKTKLYHNGVPLKHYWAVPPLSICIGLNHAIFSYCDTITLSITADKAMMPDADLYISCLQSSYQQLLKSTINKNKKAKSTQKKATKVQTQETATPKTTKLSKANNTVIVELEQTLPPKKTNIEAAL